MALRILRPAAKHCETLRALHTLTFPHDVHESYETGAWWIVWDGQDPVAFAGCRMASSEPSTLYLSRCGVLAPYRGRGLQRQLLSRRLRYARSQGASAAITTTFSNPASGNNLIRAGFRLYAPESPWGSSGTCYWRKDITPA